MISCIISFCSWLERSSNTYLTLTTTLALRWCADTCMYVSSLNYKLKLVIDSIILQIPSNWRCQLENTFVAKWAEIRLKDTSDLSI